MSDPYNAIERICMLSSALKDVAEASMSSESSQVSGAVDAVARLLSQLVEAASNPTSVVRP